MRKGLRLLLESQPEFSVVAEAADETLVMYAGQIMERGTTDQVFSDPQHPYTWGLLTSVTGLDHPRRDRLAAIPGTPPSLSDRPSGCPFEPRCRYSDRTGGLSAGSPPPLRQSAAGQFVACHLADETRAGIFAEEVQPVL